jgi:Putative DNA-binding domain
MTIETQAALLLALAEGRFEDVIGTTENSEIDFKEGVYQTETPQQKWELAKDVASFANAQGGVIVLGYGTKRDPNLLADTAAKHRPVRKSLLTWDTYRKLLDSLIYPGIDHLDGQWFPPEPTEATGVFAILIPPLPEALKYVVVSQAGAEPNVPGAVGVPIRRGSDTIWMGRETLHNHIRQSRWLSEHGLQSTTSQGAGSSLTPEKAEKRTADVEQANDWSDVPFLALHAAPSPPMSRPDDFYAESGLRGLLGSPPSLRRHGFTIQPWTPVEVGPDGSLRSRGGRSSVWLTQEGFFTAAAVGTDDFLGWALNAKKGANDPLALNSHVITEYVLEFCRFVHNILMPRAPGSRWELCLSIAGFDRQGGVILLPSLTVSGAPFWRSLYMGAKRGPRTGSTSTCVASRGAAGADAYRLMVELYAFFATPPDEIPYVDNGMISEQAILNS